MSAGTAVLAEEDRRAPVAEHEGVPATIRDFLTEGFQSEGWRREMGALAAAVGAQHMGYGYATERGLVMPFCSTLPREFVEHYVRHGYWSRDPVPLAIVRAQRTFVFDAVAKAAAGFREIFVEGGRPFGIEPPTVGVPLAGQCGHRAGIAFYGLPTPTDPASCGEVLRRAEDLARDFHQRLLAGTQVF